MNRPGDHFLAGATFADDEDVDNQIANVSDELKDLPHSCALTDDIFEAVATVDLLAEPFNLALQVVLLQGPFDLKQDFIGAKRLGHIVEGSCMHRFHGAFDAPEGCNQKYQSMGVDLF